MSKKNIFIIGLLIYICIYINNVYAIENEKYKAKVVKIIEYREDIFEYEEKTSITEVQSLKIRVLSDGIYKDKEYIVDYCLGEAGTILNNELIEDQVVYIQIQPNENNTEEKIYILDVDRSFYLLLLLGIFCFIILVIGKIQGLKTLISLGITIITIVYILIPMIMNGYNAIFTSILVCIIIATTSLLIVSGKNKKTIATIIATIIGVTIAGVLCKCFSYFADITGLVNDESQMLIYLTNNMEIDITGIFFASVLIGAIGATMDMSMSIASAMMELSEKVKNISTLELIKSGLNVGKDSMSTMSSTLILAYVGESLSLLLLVVMNSSNAITMINSDYIASEILRSLCGTIGMICSIPITTFIYGVMYKFSCKKKKYRF